jgi:hypothetical protein
MIRVSALCVESNQARHLAARSDIVNFDLLNIESPKRRLGVQTGWESFFPYYAGFPEAFARELLRSAELSQGAVVMDPWNGSGTTTYVASRLGLEARGIDINPAMVVIARARMLPASEADALSPMAATISAQIDTASRVKHGDPLCEWFAPTTAGIIRAIESGIRTSTVGEMTVSAAGVNLGAISGVAAILYVGLFGVCRMLTRMHRSSNPTWIRQPKFSSQKTSAPKAKIVELFADSVRQMASALAGREACVEAAAAGKWAVTLGDSTNSSVADGSVDFILTSPPYCTRIDYTAATRVELAVMSPLIQENRGELSRNMIGSIRVPTREIEPKDIWGTTCTDFLNKVRDHQSKASRTYYYKTHLDYFDKMSRSMQNVAASLKVGGAAILVVQDSYYKDVHNDLPTMMVEMGDNSGLELQRVEPFLGQRSMARINRHSKSYKRPASATESVLCFRRTN